MLWQQLQDKIRQRLARVETQDHPQLLQTSRRPVCYVDSEQQTIALIHSDDRESPCYSVSTSRFGLGQQQGSYQTPRGLHRIAEKIGDGVKAGEIFKSRIATGEQCSRDQVSDEEDVITTRILWLEGLEPGVNKGGSVDSYQRYIYIHGTSDEAHIGHPASIGCIRMNNSDIVVLHDIVETGDLVFIE